jgi:hypothetical protein
MSDSKALKVFKKSKRKGKFINKSDKVDPRLDEHDDESNLAKLNRDAVKSLHFLPEVERKEYGYDFLGSKGLHPDQYWPGG